MILTNAVNDIVVNSNFIRLETVKLLSLGGSDSVWTAAFAECRGQHNQNTEGQQFDCFRKTHEITVLLPEHSDLYMKWKKKTQAQALHYRFI